MKEKILNFFIWFWMNKIEEKNYNKIKILN